MKPPPKKPDFASSPLAANESREALIKELRRIARQRGVKSRATFKSRLLAAVSATLRRLARPA